MISNTSPIIFLAKINRLNLLKSLYGDISITKEVRDELFVNGKPDTEVISKAIQEGIISIKGPNKLLPLGVGKGEDSAISLAVESKDSLIIDDSFATTVAKSLNIKTLRTTTVIFTALKKRLITRLEALNLINKIIEEGYYIAPKYYKDILDKLK